MGSYVPGTKQEQQEMLREIGYASFEEMFSHIPDEVMLKEGVNIPSGLSEQADKARMEDINVFLALSSNSTLALLC